MRELCDANEARRSLSELLGALLFSSKVKTSYSASECPQKRQHLSKMLFLSVNDCHYRRRHYIDGKHRPRSV